MAFQEIRKELFERKQDQLPVLKKLLVDYPWVAYETGNKVLIEQAIQEEGTTKRMTFLTF